MIIEVDQEGLGVIHQLCDIALKSAGLKNLESINKILNSTRKVIPDSTVNGLIGPNSELAKPVKQ